MIGVWLAGWLAFPLSGDGEQNGGKGDGGVLYRGMEVKDMDQPAGFGIRSSFFQMNGERLDEENRASIGTSGTCQRLLAARILHAGSKNTARWQQDFCPLAAR